MCTEPEDRRNLTAQQAMEMSAEKWLNPSLVNPPVEFYTSEHDGKVQIFSKVPTSFGGPAHNFVAEKDTMEEAEELISRLKQIQR